MTTPPTDTTDEEPTMSFITDRHVGRPYPMRSVPGGYPGDWIEYRSGRINGKLYEFSRVRWGDGSVTVRAYKGGTSVVLHEWNSPPR